MSHLSLCSLLPVCPVTLPVLCPGYICSASTADCPTLVKCPTHAPFRCPSGECAEHGTFCAPTTRCPSSKRFLCGDGSCSSNAELCPVVRCERGEIMCGDGTCVEREALCPHRVISQEMVVRCSDGSCRSTEGFEEKRLALFGNASSYDRCVTRKLEARIVRHNRTVYE